MDWIYFVQAGQKGPIKVGFTGDFLNRFMVLQTGNHEDLRAKCLFPGGRDDETAIHLMLRKTRVRGEWYRESSAMRKIFKGKSREPAISFQKALDSTCDCGRDRAHIVQESDGIFSPLCRRCLMDRDGRLENFQAFARRTRAPSPFVNCLHCERRVKVTRHGLCGACSEYKRRTGRDRPLVKETLCSHCGREAKKLTKKLCAACYAYQRRRGKPRPI